ncbi:DUF4027 family protein [Priestia taiwanensis]|uniref:DUF4027 domain-containing protein n=1 Tax=Priestia taiwanensis TaxID=1347902 RepID=A0A917AX09_9BACI|nr:DUF4027 family protein [Priestia taiwanensis]MBM7364488.1 hypothetical protein [Priestia taiwanensis]GGE81077.1 hypothetical protein GCM10007140_33310 [Priestia taiwanensis]
MERKQDLLFSQLVTSICLGGFVLLTGITIVANVITQLFN